MSLLQQLYDKLYENISPDNKSFYIHKTGLMFDWQPKPLGVNYAQQQMVSVMPSYIEKGKSPFYSSSGTYIYDAYGTVLTSAKLDASIEQQQQLQGIDDQLSVLMAKRQKNNNMYSEMYKDAKGTDPNFPSYTDWLKENLYWDILHSDDEAIKMLTKKKSDIASASSFKWNEAYAALNSKAGFVKMMDPNETTSTDVPNFVLGQNAIEWRNKVAGGKGNAVGITLSNSKEYKSTSDFRFDAGISIYNFSASGGGGRDTLNLDKDKTTISIELEALDTINVTPDQRWYFQAYLNNLGQQGKWLNGQTTEQVFGPQGFHSVITGLVVCYRPTITMSTSSSNLETIKTVAKGGGGFSVGPFTFGGSGDYEGSTYDYKDNGASVTIKSKSEYGRVLGVMVKNPYYG